MKIHPKKKVTSVLTVAKTAMISFVSLLIWMLHLHNIKSLITAPKKIKQVKIECHAYTSSETVEEYDGNAAI